MNVIKMLQLSITASLAAGVLCAAGPTLVQAAPEVRPMAAARFLEQAAWGPTTGDIARVQALGMEGWLDEQIHQVPALWSPIPPPSVNANGNTSLRPAQDAFFVNAVNGRDQLRQRVAFALSQIFVVSGVKLQPQAMVPYLRLLQADAFETYDRLLYDVTLSPAMGRYLDMVNNNKPTPGRGANENYAREVLQLFSIGLVQLDSAGRPLLDSKGEPIPTFDQDVIEGFGRTFTGWTYAPQPGANSRFGNPPNWDAPMVAIQANHDVDAKLLLNGYTMPLRRSAQVDLQDALNNISQHPNVGPFISRQLIQRLVTSQPSPEYVQRVASVFNLQPRGDLGAVVKAILLDPEARQGDDGQLNAATKLREPALWISALMRGLNVQVADSNGLLGSANTLGQLVYYPQTVFNYFHPGYEITLADGKQYNAPEFELLGEASATAAANFVNAITYGRVPGVTVDFTPYIAQLSAKPTAAQISHMVDSLNVALLGGRMTEAMHDTITAAAQKATTPKAMVQMAVYLIASSWDFQVQR